jgi:hypothetical protein
MPTNWLRVIQKPRAAILLMLAMLAFSRAGLGQQVSYALLQPGAIEPAPFMKSARPVMPIEAPRHRFWDRENSLLFATSAAFSAGDFLVTRSILQNGGQELNPVTRLFSGSTAGLAANFAGETVGVVGLSYFFHKTGHHKMERLVSVFNIGSSAAAVSFDLAHR